MGFAKTCLCGQQQSCGHPVWNRPHNNNKMIKSGELLMGEEEEDETEPQSQELLSSDEISPPSSNGRRRLLFADGEVVLQDTATTAAAGENEEDQDYKYVETAKERKQRQDLNLAMGAMFAIMLVAFAWFAHQQQVTEEVKSSFQVVGVILVPSFVANNVDIERYVDKMPTSVFALLAIVAMAVCLAVVLTYAPSVK
ncbi:hypothetical protein BASA81_000415 [Batrachochytrium salamandrivorans]|nr:hypothetical protein BASA81_000415 [Batrachochytrium salamandrivorans]